ncbi:hypothetical protein ES705_20026 [subsurface metagenome]|nr:hypothetical protein [Clostridia bacterium]
MDTFSIVMLIVAIYSIGSFVVVTILSIWDIYKGKGQYKQFNLDKD